jgi:hypothetical protein
MDESDNLYTAIAVLVFVAVTLGVKFWLIGSMGSAYIEEETTGWELDKITVTHLIEACLLQGQNHIDSAFLDTNNEAKTCELCSICAVSHKVYIKDIETGKEWQMGHTKTEILKWGGKEETHKINVNIKDGNEIHIGELNVRI